MSGEFQVNVKAQSELDIGGRETCLNLRLYFIKYETRSTLLRLVDFKLHLKSNLKRLHVCLSVCKPHVSHIWCQTIVSIPSVTQD